MKKTMKKTILATFAVLCSTCLYGGIKAGSELHASAESAGASGSAAGAQTITFSETKLNVSKTNMDKMLIVTAINDAEYLSNVSAIGYEITGYTVGTGDIAATDKYYSTLTVGTEAAKTAEQLGFTGATADSKLLVWEIAYSPSITYQIKAYADVYDATTEKTTKVYGTVKTNQVKVTYMLGEDVLGTQKVNYGATASFSGFEATSRDGYEIVWKTEGGEAFTSETKVKGDTVVSAIYEGIKIHEVKTAETLYVAAGDKVEIPTDALAPQSPFYQEEYDLVWKLGDTAITGTSIAVDDFIGENVKLTCVATHKTNTSDVQTVYEKQYNLVGVTKDTTEYLLVKSNEADFAGIEFEGEITEVTDLSGTALEYTVSEGKVYFTSLPLGATTVLIKGANACKQAEVYAVTGLISNAQELKAAAERMTDETVYALTADIDMSNYGWTVGSAYQLLTFKGEFNGRGYKLYNVVQKDKTKSTEAFTFANESHVFNTGFAVSIDVHSADSYVGIFGNIGTTAVVENCIFDIDGDSSWSSATFKSIDGTLKNSVLNFKQGKGGTMLTLWAGVTATITDITVIGVNGDVAASSIVSANGGNFKNYHGTLKNIYIYETLANAIAGNGYYFGEEVHFNGQTFTVQEWWNMSDKAQTAVTEAGISGHIPLVVKITELTDKTLAQVFAGSALGVSGNAMTIAGKEYHRLDVSTYESQVSLLKDGTAKLTAPEFMVDYAATSVTATTYAVEDSTIVSEANGTLTALKVGTTKVTATLTLANNATYTIVYTVNVYEPNETASGTYDYSLDGTTATALPFGDHGTVTKVLDAKTGASLEFTQSGTDVTLKNLTLRGNRQVLVASDTYMILYNVTMADGFVTTADDLLAMGAKMTNDTLFVINADIDFTGKAWTVVDEWSTRFISTIKGELDGRGHKLYNIAANDNTKFSKVVQGFDAGSYMHDIYFDLDNFQMLGYSDGCQGFNEAVFGGVSTGATVENCVFDCDFNFNYYDAIFQWVNGTVKDNVMIFRQNTHNWLISCRLSATAVLTNNVAISTQGKFGGEPKAQLVGQKQSGGWVAQPDSAVKGFYVYNSIENALNGTGFAFDDDQDGNMTIGGEVKTNAEAMADNVALEATTKKLSDVLDCVAVREGVMYWYNIALQ